MWYYKKLNEDDQNFVAVNQCEICGIEFRSLSPSTTKYCPDCGEKIRKDQNRERVRRYRERLKD